MKAAIKQFSAKGYHSTTVKDIADEAGVSAGLIYQYVSDKEDLLFLALQHIVQRNKEEVPRAAESVDDPIVALYRAVDAYSRVLAANQQAVLLTYRETKSLGPEYIERMKELEIETNQLIADRVEKCIEAGYLAQVHVELLVYRIIFGAHAWPLKHWRLRQIVSFEEYLDEVIHATWKAYLLPRGMSRYEALLRSGELQPTEVKPEQEVQETSKRKRRTNVA